MDELLLELKKSYGADAVFREGQEEAVRDVLQGKRILVVQKTGWGKSLVYFLATKIIRKKLSGITLIISPLLALMNNQIDSANKLGLHVETINSSNQDEWNDIIECLKKGQIDALIISPERLSNDVFKEIMTEQIASQIGLFVVDEAHCISDWGHDFRPDYKRIVDIVNMLPSNIPVLATTATANNRVVNDIKMQLGNKLQINRGSLMRESLSIQVIHLKSKEERLAWISSNIALLPGTGIIYCLTVNDCKLLNKWLNSNNILSESYYARIDEEENKDKNSIIEQFMNNKIKVLVATIAFGMGFDKPDIGFVIHFQKPGNIVAYYQQIGRAGRAIKQAYAILLCGDEDDEINSYFIDSAFPTEYLMNNVIETIMEHPGLKKKEFEKYINMKPVKIAECINYLLVNGDIYSDNKSYYKTPRLWKPDLNKSKEITEIRKKELRQMNEFTRTSDCYMEFIARVLDDPEAQKCGNCPNCIGHMLIPYEISKTTFLMAQQFIKEDFNIIKPRKKWPVGVKIDSINKIAEEFLCEEGWVLSNYGDAGWGKVVADGKYKKKYFDEELVEASYELLKEFVQQNDINWVTNISSIRSPELVKGFAERLANKLKLPYFNVIIKKKGAKYQKELNNSYLQFQNAYDSFEIKDILKENVLLVDDMVDSGWTFTVCGFKLKKMGCGKVYPFALANSAGKNGDK